jgi:hypothetical protein
MQDPYAGYHRYTQRRHRAQAAMVVGTVLVIIGAISASVIAWDDQRATAAFESTAGTPH